MGRPHKGENPECLSSRKAVGQGAGQILGPDPKSPSPSYQRTSLIVARTLLKEFRFL